MPIASMKSTLFLSAAIGSLSLVSATPVAAPIEERQILTGILGLPGTITTDLQGAVSALQALQPSATPTSAAQAYNLANSIFAASSNSTQNIAGLIANDFVPGDLTNVAATYSAGINSENNYNPRDPFPRVYPYKAPGDAPYDLSESQLRRVIYIPSTFTYGKKPPVILVPGTGSKGGLTFGSNFIKLFQGVNYADPVWLNIPDFLLDDAQVNAEYVAYAMNYISGIANKKVSVIAWSQGNLDTQWAFKYWPSTRLVTNNLISISPDFHGTQLAYFACPGVPGQVTCTPSLIQQEYNSNFVTTLRRNGGDSAYVPTTTIYSATDEIVQPQSGTGASAYINDARRVGVTNAQVQVVCAGKAGGGAYTHEGILYHPLAFALAVDALQNGGPGSLSRTNAANNACNNFVTPGLSAADVLATEGEIQDLQKRQLKKFVMLTLLSRYHSRCRSCYFGV